MKNIRFFIWKFSFFGCKVFNIYLKPKVTLQHIFIRFTNFCWVKFKQCFNNVKEQAFVHMVYSTWALFVKQIIKRGSRKAEGVRIKSYDINSLLEGHCTLNTSLFQ